MEAWSHKLGKICPTISLLNKAYKHDTFIQHLMSLAGTIVMLKRHHELNLFSFFDPFLPMLLLLKDQYSMANNLPHLNCDVSSSSSS